MDDNPVGFLIFFFANLSFSIIIFYFFLREEKGSKVKYKVIKNEEMQEFGNKKFAKWTICIISLFFII
ncbi:hypothetical protein PFBG_03964 [Plasmodium falciparum 7G8]|uniref:Uncharacterized protein n=1 Tax=Plasmodium falciparum (isolate 7G8) TaxID=57266 RepID=W7FI98_PLAF8|nr:hypothetical protein PFBG_03964 [Plasmodium falciparum 7G8]